jgi:UDP-N-acetylmuramoyl-L-alanyl-D-glutamate--2,6-diaminopimelate ligase
VFIDYAHTPDALLNVLSVLSALTTGKIICVFGAGGDRDPGKRSQMGAVVAQYADIAVVTSDNPRTEEPESIVSDILEGIPEKTQVHVEVNRSEAIAHAIKRAQPEDVVLIAGKGHEDYQIIGTQRIPFHDGEEARKVFATYSF